ncbi:MAG: flagellar filament capping protein FliD [Gammaproteobacteria bacterium]|nr:flagellar filament capping protein FliD [Gammaproteobacteria bacterium]
MPISSPGLGSGLDVSGIVSQLMALEQQPLLRLDQKEAQVQAEISAYGVLKGSLSTLQESLTKLKDTDTFLATSAVSSNEDVLTVSSDSDAVPSSYNVTINRLAQFHKLGSVEHASADTFGGTSGDSLTITVGSSSFTLDLSTASTLSEIQQAINADSNTTGVTAGLITGDSGNQTLVLSSSASGYDNRVQLAYAGTIAEETFGFSMLNQDANGQPLAAETELDASLIVEGVTVTRGSNTISDVVAGLTLSLQSTGQATASISKDTSVASKALDGFINAYNGLKEQLSALRSSVGSGSLIRNIESQLRNVLNTKIPGAGAYSYISELGVTSNADTGKLEFDTEKFISALEENPDAINGFFGDEDKGFLAQADRLLNGFLESGGTIDSMMKGAQGRVKGIEQSREAMERRLESTEQRYLKQFGALDTLMASLTTTSDYLTSQLDALSRMINPDN